MFDLNWLDKIRAYVTFASSQVEYLSARKQTEKLEELFSFVSRYTNEFKCYICQLYDMRVVSCGITTHKL